MTASVVEKPGAVAGLRRTGAGEAPSPVPVQFTIPTPPSSNTAFRNVRGKGRVKTQAYKDWLVCAFQSIRMQKIGRIEGHHIVVVGVERASSAADIDNRIKLTLDALVSARVIEDDRFTTAIAICWLPMANGLTHVQVHPVGPLSLEFRASTDGATGAWITAPPPEQGEGNGLVSF